MKRMNLGGLALAATMLGVVILGSANDAGAQTRRQIERERERAERQYERSQKRREREVRSRGSYDDRYTSRGSTPTTRAGSNNAVSLGYQQGLLAGQTDRRDRKYNRFNVYRNSGSAPNSGDPTSYDYLYRQG